MRRQWVFYDRHFCRIPRPPEVQATFGEIDDDPTVYHTVNGPSEFRVIRTIRNWSIILVAAVNQQRPRADAVKPMEETDGWLDVVGGFLAEHD
jgi:hypothetical protein